MTAEVRSTLEPLSFRAWPPLESTSHDGWVLRYAGGYSRRGNSATPGDDLIVGVDAQVEFGRRWYADRGLGLVVRLLSGMEDLDAELAARGFSMESPVDTMASSVLPAWSENTSVRITPHPGDEWFEFHRPLLGPDRRNRVDAWRGILAAVEPSAGFGLLEVDDRVVAAGFAVVDRGWVGLFQLAVRPEHRRQGFGRRLSEALLSWGAARGATRGYLQVEQANAAGVGLYRELGFRPAYTYWYRRDGR